MSKGKWTSKAAHDVRRIHKFLAFENAPAAERLVASLMTAPRRILENPRLGERLDEFEPREVRRLIVGHYELRYELSDGDIYVLRIWHTREER